MKKTLTRFAVLSAILFPSITYAQQWAIAGNALTGTGKLGSTNNNGVSFLTNNTERFNISGGGTFKINGLAGTGNGFIKLNSNGELSRTSFSGTATDVLTGDATFAPIYNLTGWLVGSGKTTTTAKVGIGISSPSKELEVGGDIAASGTVFAQKFTVMDVSSVNGSIAFTSNMYLTGYDPSAFTRNAVYSSTQPFYLQSETGFNMNTLINAGNTGKVGIGTASPTEKLHVVGDFKLEGDLDAEGLKIGDLTIGYAEATSGLPALLNMHGDAGGSGEPPFPVPPCITPTVPLINVVNGFYSSYAYSGGNPYTMVMGVNGTNGIIDVAGSDAKLLINKDCGKDVLMCTGTLGGNFYMGTAITGKVGLGTTTPLGDFEIRKTNGVQAYFTSTTSNDAFIKVGNNLMGYTFGANSSGVGQITDGTNNLISFLHGNVGIGTDCMPPGHPYKLSVDGLILCEGVKVDMSNGSGCWPDFVFAKDYKLKSLYEVEAFINQNHHLPDVPSAAEVEKDGLNLEKANEILLQKIEELTLYVISLKKEIDEIKNK